MRRALIYLLVLFATLAPTARLYAADTATPDATMPVKGSVAATAVWMSPAGLALYVYKNDPPGVATCVTDCAKVWPPLTASATSLPTGDFTIVKRTDSSDLQWAYRGKPLYTFGPDTPGSAHGDGQEGFSYAVIQ